jgi:hypothetical protein
LDDESPRIKMPVKSTRMVGVAPVVSAMAVPLAVAW